MSQDRPLLKTFTATFVNIVSHLSGEYLLFKKKFLQEMKIVFPIEKIIFLQETSYRNFNCDII